MNSRLVSWLHAHWRRLVAGRPPRRCRQPCPGGGELGVADYEAAGTGSEAPLADVLRCFEAHYQPAVPARLGALSVAVAAEGGVLARLVAVRGASAEAKPAPARLRVVLWLRAAAASFAGRDKLHGATTARGAR